MANEEWRPIPGFDGYLVSDMGRVESLPRVALRIGKKGGPLIIRGKILKATPVDGYPRVSLRANGNTYYRGVHQLVLLAFVGPCPKGQEGRHLDGHPTHNALKNLQYGTRAQNIDDAKRHGTFPRYEKRPGAKLTREQAKEIAESFETGHILAQRYGVKRGTIYQVRNGWTWSAITADIRRTRRHPNAKITEEQAKSIAGSTEHVRTLAKEFGVALLTITNIRRGKTWKEVTAEIRRHRPTPTPLRGSRIGTAKLTEEQVRAILLDTRSTRILARVYNIDRRMIMFIRQGKSWKHVARPQSISLDPASIERPDFMVSSTAKSTPIITSNLDN